MKKQLSIPGLFARSTLVPILALLLMMGVAELLLFRHALNVALTAYEADVGYGMISLEQLIKQSRVSFCFGAAFLLITLLLCLPGCEFRTKTGYTWRRLSVSAKAVFLWQFAYNTLIYLLLAACQVLLVYGLCRSYLAAAPAEWIGNQTLFLAFWRSEHLHALLPLSDVALWIRNLSMLLSLGLASAIFPLKQREQRYSGSIIAMAVFCLFSFHRGIADISHAVIAFVVLFMVLCELLSFVLTRNQEEEEEEGDHA